MVLSLCYHYRYQKYLLSTILLLNTINLALSVPTTIKIDAVQVMGGAPVLGRADAAPRRVRLGGGRASGLPLPHRTGLPPGADGGSLGRAEPPLELVAASRSSTTWPC